MGQQLPKLACQHAAGWGKLCLADACAGRLTCPRSSGPFALSNRSFQVIVRAHISDVAVSESLCLRNTLKRVSRVIVYILLCTDAVQVWYVPKLT